MKHTRNRDNTPHYKPFILPASKAHYARSRDADIRHVKLELNVDPERKILEGTVYVELVPIADDVSKLHFDAVDLEVKDVKLSGRLVEFENTGEKLVIDLGKPLKPVETSTVTIRYSGKPQRGIYFIGPNKSYPDLPYQVWTQGEDEDSRFWFPCYDFPNNRATSEVIVTVPQKYTAVSNGILTETVENKARGTRTLHWKQEIPHSSYLTSLVVGDYSIIKDKVENIELQYYVPKGREEDAKRSFATTPKMIRFFGEYFGVKYPYPKYALVVVSDFIHGGMENISATTLKETIIQDKRAQLDHTSDDLLSHELAHQWWGDLITCRDWSHAWLNEGFATYSEVLFKEHDIGKDEADIYQIQENLDKYIEEDRERYRRPIVTKIYADPSELFDRNLYEKGELVLHALRYFLGETLFQKGLSHYANTFREKVVETSDFRRAMEDATGKSLESFFDQWVYHAGHPEFKVAYDWDENGTVKLTVSQTQAAEGETPAVFQTPVDVSFTTSSGVQTRRIMITQRNETFQFPLPERPMDVEFDPGNWILKTLEFDKPKNMSLYQLANDKNMVGRVRAAARLTKYSGQEVVDALKTSTLMDPFWGVQAEAAKALGMVRTTGALKALLSALKVKNPKARRAVVKALGEFRDEEAANALVTILEDGDASYFVEGEAARSLGKTRSPKASEVLKKNLRKESFEEAIRIGIFDGYGELRDPQSIPIVMEWTRYGKPHKAREAATKALGKLGEARSEVSDHLIYLLDDPWFNVRIEAANALAQLLESKALDPLNRLIEKEPDGRTRRRAREAIQKIEEGRTASYEFRQLRDEVDRLREENRNLRERLEKIETVQRKKR